jgi:hypothetical protein
MEPDVDRRTVLRGTAGTGTLVTAGCARSTDSSDPATTSDSVSPETAGGQSTPSTPGEATGVPVGLTHDYSTTVDPSEYEDDSTAIQALNERLLEHVPENFGQGVIRIPPLKPDGSQWSFPRTVTFGDPESNRLIVPQGTLWGGGTTVREWTTTIDDGSPIFHVPGNLAEDSANPAPMPIGGFAISGSQGQDFEAIRLTHLTIFDLRQIYLVQCAQGPDSDGAVVFEGSCHNAEVDRIHYRAYNQNTEASRQTAVYAYRERGDTSGPGEIVFGPGCRSRFGYGRVFDQTEGNRNPSTYWYGHSERWERDYAMQIHAGSLYVCSTARFGHPSDENEDAGVVNVEGYNADGEVRSVVVANEAQFGSPNGKPALRLNGVPKFRVQPFSTYGHPADQTVISVPTPPDTDSLLPTERVLAGTVDAPELEAGVAYAVVPGGDSEQ